ISAPEAVRMKVGIVQGNIDQSLKWSPSQQQITVDTYLALSASLMRAASPPDLVIWPETALPFFPTNEQMGPLKMAVKSGNMALLTGAPWYEIIDRQNKKVKYYNSAFLLSPDGGFAGKYFKTHLVPFGEYVPMKKLLPFLAPLVEAVGDFSFGTIAKPLVWHEAKAGILICFESVFPELSRQWVQAGANILVNLTNDAWYGKSSAPQHSLAMAVLRAVEARRSLIRSANTGISAFVNPAGGIDDRSGLFEPWAAARDAVLMTDITIWVRFGHLFAPFCLIIACFGTAVGRRLRCREYRLREYN
ncbi:MAG: apolipoprotein N-acyltransferase, partial [Desulfobacterales bacterium GWB2_56_26]